jgi:hypothetical protein
MLQAASLPVNRLKECRDREVRLFHIQGEQTIIFAN